MLETLLAAGPVTVIVQRAAWPDLRQLRRAIAEASAERDVAYAIRLDVTPAVRLLTAATLRLQLRLVEHAIVRSGRRVVGRYGVDPSLDAPVWLFELDTLAAQYADRCLRPRGRAPRLRRALARWLGCDPAVGAIVVVAGRTCC